jgi:hypothetical protein
MPPKVVKKYIECHLMGVKESKSEHEMLAISSI